MNHILQIKSAEITPDKEYDYDHCFRYISPILESADLAIGNLELTFPGKPPYQGYPVFRSPDQLASSIKKAGFDVLVTANNHSNDGGQFGVSNTLKTLQKNDFLFTGTYATPEEKELYHPLLIFKKGFKIAVLNYTYGTNGIPTHSPTIVNMLDKDKIKADLELTKKLKPDFTIVVVHWGSESNLNENDFQTSLAKDIEKWGANLIVGAHPHVIQPIKELDSGTQEEPVLVVYSLGNLISHQMKPNTDIGILFEITLVKENKVTRLDKHNYIPIYRYIFRPPGKKVQFFTLPISVFENDAENLLSMLPRDIKQMNDSVRKLRKRFSSSVCKERKISLQEMGPIKKLNYN